MAAHLFDRPIHELTLDRCTLVYRDVMKRRRPMSTDAEQESDVREMVCFNLAGPAADRWYFRDDPQDYPLDGWAGDEKAVGELAVYVKEYTGLDIEQIILVEESRADDLMRDHWPTVTTLATELLARGKLPGDAVYAIINRELGRLAG